MRWVRYIKANPGTWKKHHTAFINAQYDKAYQFLERLAQTREGQQKIVEMYGIKNVKGYPKLLDKLQS